MTSGNPRAYGRGARAGADAELDERRDPPSAAAARPAHDAAPDLLRMQESGGNAMVVRLMHGPEPDGGGPADAQVAARIRGRLGLGESLPAELGERYAPAVGAPLGDVHMHRDAEAADLARQVGARAFTTGTDVFFGAGAYEPDTRRGAALLVHELTHTTQAPATGAATGPLAVTDPADASEVAADAAARRLDARAAPAGPVATARVAGGGPLTVARQPEGSAGAVPERYAGLVTPSLNDADARMLQQVTGGADLVNMIKQRDSARARMAEISHAVDRGNMSEGAAFEDYDRLDASVGDLTPRIDAELAALGVANESDLLALVNDRFPRFFLAEAKQVALDMLKHNEDEGRAELDRYSAQVCSPDIDGLLEADRALNELDPTPTEISIRTAEEALARYAPIAGVVSNEELAAMIPEHQQSVMVDIANLERNRALLEQRRAIYNAARYSHGRRYPILLANGYRPGAFAMAPPEELGKLVAEPVNEMLENISRVRGAINDDELKVWNMRDVLRITQERLGANHPVLLAAVEARIKGIEKDERFMSWVVAALAITTTVVAGVLFTPAAGAAVAAAWGVHALAGSIDTYLNESAAENIALDPAVADLSLNEPTLTWVVLDALFLGLDLAPIAKALRPAARTLTHSPNALTLQAFRREAAGQLGEDAAEQLTRRAAARHGLEAAALDVAEAQLAHARTVLAGLDLSDDAIARILSKGTDVNQVKGQLFEEIMHADVARRLAQGGSEALGVADNAAVEVIQGHRIADLGGAQLTDGMIVRRLPDGSLEIVTVLEAKAGRSAAQGLRTSAHGIGDPEEFARFMIEENRNGVLRVLRKAGLKADADAVAAGGETLSEAAIEAVAADKALRRTVTQAELGGQIRRDIERLSPNVSTAEDLASHLDEAPMQILVDGVPTTVRMSPTRTRFVGAVPQDVPTDAITRSLREEGFSYESLAVGPQAADLTARAQRLAEEAAARAAAATTP